MVARASGIEGVYTGMENVLKELLAVADGGVFSSSESYHAQLLAQAAQKTDSREPVLDGDLYDKIDRLRAFRHRERTNYRHVLRDDLVKENFKLLVDTFPVFERQVQSFIAELENKPKDGDEAVPGRKM